MPRPAFTRYQRIVVGILAFLQFTVIIDFMIMSPLGAIIMPAMQITPKQFGVAVSVYAFSAGASGLLAAGFADKYDRKKLLLVFYVGFLVGTLVCGIAETYEILLVGRMVAGLFGGVLGSVVMAIVTDLFPLETRGRVMGIIQTAFAASQVLGLPAGIYFSNHWGWHAPFLIIVGIGLVAGVVMMTAMQPVDAHLKHASGRNAARQLWTTLVDKRHGLAFATTAILSIGGFMLMPFASAYTTHNLGRALDELPIIYLASGLATIFIAPAIGRISEKIGYLRTFLIGSGLSIVMVVIYTNLGVTPLWLLIAINIVMFCGIFSRMIPSQALMSAIPAIDRRGAFMALSSSLGQVAGGLASVLAGAIIVQGDDGTLLHFDRVGYTMVGTVTASMILMTLLARGIRMPAKEGAP